jgi:hypothetical protein
MHVSELAGQLVGAKMDKAKRLYAVLWVDDWSSFPLRKKDIRWFHENAGPLSVGLEMDDRISQPFKKQFRQLRESSSDHSTDYLSHHYHATRWIGPSFIKKACDFLRLRWYAYFITRLLGVERLAERARIMIVYRNKPRITQYLLVASGILPFLALSLLFYTLNPTALIVFWALCIVLLGPIALFIYTQLKRNWEYTFSNWGKNRAFLQELKKTMQKEGLHYPVVLRHGWHFPPESSMEFYMAEMNALADASAIATPGYGPAVNKIGRLIWRNTTPYYASLSRDYDVPWDSLDEEDRGILELPVNLGNIAEHGFTVSAKQMIEQTPDGSLVSTYIHGWDDFGPIKDWVDYLKKNYDVKFVRADEYANIYMQQHPRPVLINDDFKANWALKRGGRLQGITEIDKEIVSVELLQRNEELTELLLNVSTKKPVPEIGIALPRVKTLQPELTVEVNDGMTVMREVQSGNYRLEVRHSEKVVPDR